MVRKLKYHEQKLLKKVDFLNWQSDNSLHEMKIVRRFHLQHREDYTRYNCLARQLRELARRLRELPAEAPFRAQASAQLLDKAYQMGLIATRWNLQLVDRVTASSFCRRRLPVLMVRQKMAPSVRMATQLVQQGHVRVGTELVTDPALFVTRHMEDFVTWSDASAVRKHVLEYNGERDDFEL